MQKNIQIHWRLPKNWCLVKSIYSLNVPLLFASSLKQMYTQICCYPSFTDSWFTGETLSYLFQLPLEEGSLDWWEFPSQIQIHICCSIWKVNISFFFIGTHFFKGAQVWEFSWHGFFLFLHHEASMGRRLQGKN